MKWWGSAVGENVVTKYGQRDLDYRLMSRLNASGQRMESRLDAFEQRMSGFEQRIVSQLEALRFELQAMEQRRLSDAKSLEPRMTIKLGALVFAGSGVLAGLMAIVR